jgi:hypothetical protein
LLTGLFVDGPSAALGALKSEDVSSNSYLLEISRFFFTGDGPGPIGERFSHFGQLFFL